MLKAKTADLVFLNVIILTIYFIVFANLKIGVSEHIMFSTPDSHSYLNVADYFINGMEKDNAVSIRPFLYPLIIVVSFKTFGAYGLWIVQLLFWIVSVNLLFFSVKKITGNRLISYTAGIIAATNLSLIALTLHGLTEVTTVFLLSVLIYFIVHHIESRKELRFFQGALFILVLLTVVKPLFYLIVLLLLLIIFPVFYLKKYIQHPKKIILLLIILFPLLFQMTFMKIKFNVFKVSTIDTITLRDYLFAQGFAKINNIERDSALIRVKDYSNSEVTHSILNNKKEYAALFLANVQDNCQGYPNYLDYPSNMGNEQFKNFMIHMNSFYYHLHKYFIIPVLLLLLLFLKTKKISHFILICSTSLLLYYILLSSGISAYQGDRLTLSGLPLWIFLYCFTFYYWSELILRKFIIRNNVNPSK